ncbi:MAG: hypothetical protein QOF63_4010 [Thermoanaerobaculia bacterium]|nr:hypothetical protein [Thermoanaerobaculia bacterium]
MADVRVGIVSWNTADLLDRCLAALPAALAGLDAEIVVLDNDSADGSADVAARHDGIDVIRNPENVGYARGMNRALAGSTAPVLIALNPDTEAPPGSLAALVRRLLDDPGAGLVVPQLINADGSLQHSVYRFPSIAVALAVGLVPASLQRRTGLGRHFWLEGASAHDAPATIDWAIGAVHVIRVAALDGEQPYSERWFMYAEDTELCWRLTRAGWTVKLEPDVVVPHIGNASGEQAWGKERAARFWAASYDLVALRRGRVYARLWAAVNTAVVALHIVLRTIGSRLPGNRAHRRRTLPELRSVLPVHARAVWRGADPAMVR